MLSYERVTLNKLVLFQFRMTKIQVSRGLRWQRRQKTLQCAALSQRQSTVVRSPLDLNSKQIPSHSIFTIFLKKKIFRVATVLNEGQRDVLAYFLDALANNYFTREGTGASI